MEVTARDYVNYLHILIVFPFLLYIGWMGRRTPDLMFTTLIGVSLVGFAYHLMSLYSRR